jgi:glutamate-1-semialdehyde 2,1-aminomutase
MIPYGRHSINDRDIEAVVNALKSDWLTTGPLVEEFEMALEKVVGAPCITVSSGTAALHCAYAAIGLEQGDEVITPPITFIATQATAVILEPMNAAYPEPGFLESVQKATQKAGALLIFDETITGFRFAKGGAQELFGVTPDLSTFGKGMANGFPISAVVGRRDVMIEMEEIFFSGTFGGELLSLAAAKSVLERHAEGGICEELKRLGAQLADKVEVTASQNGLQNIVALSGHPSWKFLNWTATATYTIDELKTYFMQQAFQKGLLVLSTHNITTAFNERIINKASMIYGEVFEEMNDAIKSESLTQKLKVKPLKPLFRVR